MPSSPHRISIDSRDDKPRGGQSKADRAWYTANVSDSNWTREDLIKGFNITIREHDAALLWLMRKIQAADLASTNFSTNVSRAKLDATLDEMEGVFPWSQSHAVGRLWRQNALIGFARAAAVKMRKKPDIDFENLSAFPFKKHYLEYDADGSPTKPAKRKHQLPLFKNCIVRVTARVGRRDGDKVTLMLEDIVKDRALNELTGDVKLETVDLDMLETALVGPLDFKFGEDSVAFVDESGEHQVVHDGLELYNAIVKLRRSGNGATILNFHTTG